MHDSANVNITPEIVDLRESGRFPASRCGVVKLGDDGALVKWGNSLVGNRDGEKRARGVNTRTACVGEYLCMHAHF